MPPRSLALLAPSVGLAIALTGCGAPVADAGPSGAGAGGKADVLGEDDRTPIDDSDDPRAKQWAGAVGLLTRKVARSGALLDEVPTFGGRHDLCEGQRFSEEPVLGHCSSFLVAPNIVATAAHCLPSTSCADTRVVFDFHDGGRNRDPLDLDPSAIFQCVDAIVSPVEDAALLVLDRSADGRTPFPLQADGGRVGDRLALLGFPLGIPAKLDTSGEVFAAGGTRFFSTLDSFPGHSGGVVIDLDTGNAVGVHVTGGQPSLISSGECNVSASCALDAVVAGLCRGSGELSIASLPLDRLEPSAIPDAPLTDPSPPSATCRDRCLPAPTAGAAVHQCECSRDCDERGTCCADFEQECEDNLDVCSPPPATCTPGSSFDCRDAECTCAAGDRFTETFVVPSTCRPDGRCPDVASACATACTVVGATTVSATNCVF